MLAAFCTGVRTCSQLVTKHGSYGQGKSGDFTSITLQKSKCIQNKKKDLHFYSY